MKTSKERLLDSAVAEFAEKGLAGARIGDIASRAEINKQLVYHYFGSKEALYAQALDHVLSQSRRDDDPTAFASLDPAEALLSFIDGVIESSLSDSVYQRLLLDANWHRAQHIDINWDSVKRMRARVDTLASILHRGTAQGVFRDGLDPLEVYLSIMGAFSIRLTNAYSLAKTLGADLLTPDGRARSQSAALDMLLEGLKARPQAD